MIIEFQPLHIVNKRPWAFLVSFCRFSLVISGVRYFYYFDIYSILVSIIFILYLSYIWWKDIGSEGRLEGRHTNKIITSLYFSIILFILSEVCFFFSFFWGYFHRRLRPCFELGIVWPPVGVVGFNPYTIPLLNSSILLSSGVTVTWAHHSVVRGRYNNYIYRIIITVGLGAYFSYLQNIEYIESFFSFADRVYGRIFFLATGFHGLHVIIGRLFLLINLIRSLLGNFNSEHHIGLELSIWYWHFVDVVWLFLYICVYWWGY